MKSFFNTRPVIFVRNTGFPGMPRTSITVLQDAVEHGADVLAVDIALNEHGDPVITDGNEGAPTAESPILGDVLSAIPGQRFCLYLNERSRELAGALCDVVRDTGAEERVLVSSNHGDNLRIVRLRCPGAATSFTLMGAVGFYWLSRSGLLAFRKSFRPDALLIPEGIGVSFFANQGLITMAHDRGIHVYVYIMNSGAQVRRLMESGADGFITEDLLFLKGELEKNLPAGEDGHE